MKKLIAITILATVLFGCDDWLDVNTDPNNPVSVTPDLILPVAQVYTAKIMQEDRGVNHLGNMTMYNWSESAGFSWYNDEFLYLSNSTYYDQIFDNSYEHAMKQYMDLVELPAEYGAYSAIGKIMLAYHFQLLVDFYGDVPYFDALKRGAAPNPAYDDAAVIYDSLVGDLDEAIALINNEASIELPGADDAVYGGDMDAWKQFANAVKLRILTRVSDTRDVTADLAAIATEGSGYPASTVSINPGYVNQEGQQSPLWTSFGQDVAGNTTLSGNATCASDFMIQYLTDTNDPRIDFLFEEPAGGHLGVTQGITSDPDTQGFEQVSNLGPGLLVGATQDAPIMTLAEMYFNQAELAIKGYGGDPATLFASGVEAAFVELGLTAADAAAYIAQPNQAYPAAGSTAEQWEAVITQKWLGVQGMTAEQSWFDWSRTGYPTGLPVSSEQPGLTRPFRLHYPASEIGVNAPNLPEQPDPFTAKVFWGN